MSPIPISPTTCIVRRTHVGHGRITHVTPERGATRWLRYGRIALRAGERLVPFGTGDCETALIGLRGAATVRADGRVYTVGRYDALYVPRDLPLEIAAGADGVDLAELAAPVAGRYEVAFVAFADVQQDPALHFRTGGAGCARDLSILIGKNVSAGRLLAGVTFSDPGNWTSWPPHEHGATLEEAYLYIDMPAPAFAVQLVYTDRDDPEVATIVREGDCVVMPQGFHPNVAAPGGRVGFLWFMAAHREGIDRQFGVVNVQPDFAEAGSGLEASRR
jgi:5-deoxy-glucuronate isomerase